MIFIAERQTAGSSRIAVTKYQRWLTEAREQLFDQIEYAPILSNTIYPDLFSYASALQETLFRKLKAKATKTIGACLERRASEVFVFYQEATQ
ncbi:MAG: hypothetical protein IPK19_31245 [Chloroflexi bacterium]|nr:hypothetical protein [Chloroflexota bacterium]